jgi:hypothetical protein
MKAATKKKLFAKHAPWLLSQETKKTLNHHNEPTSLDTADLKIFAKEYGTAYELAEERYNKALDYLGKDFMVSFVSVPENPHMEDSGEKYNFLVNLNGQEFYFSQSHCDLWEPCFGKPSYDARIKGKGNLEGQNAFPDIFGLLNCLSMDQTATQLDFAEWAEDYGYDSDSISARNIYDACQKQTFSAKKVLDLDKVQADLEEMGEN